jgi:hypothetical protein
MVGFYTIIGKLKTELNSSPFVNSVTEGSIFNVDLAKQTIFPLSHIMVNSASFEENVMRFNVSIIAMDIVDISKDETTDVFRGNDNEQDVLNTQLAVLQRVYEVMRRGTLYTELFQVDGSPNCEPFTERFENLLAGWTMTFDVLVPNEMSICDNSPTVSVYSQVVNFDPANPVRPRYNSIQYLCDGDFLAASYGTNEENLTDLIAMFNSVPPVQEQATFLDYGICYDNGDGRVRMEMTQAAYNALGCDGTLTLNVIYD